jgi:adenosylcobinamide kinase/adenosylcobinamide-phosphate guanylyltransferase
VAALTLVTGGARSGKSRHALALADGYARKAFIATAEACDEEMRERIARHRAARGTSFRTIEEPVDLSGAIRSLAGSADVAVVDCLTVWLGNLFGRRRADEWPFPEVVQALAAFERPPCDLVVVTNEVGMGIVPANELARRYRDCAGELNQQVAHLACRVVFMVCGMPVAAKERPG